MASDVPVWNVDFHWKRSRRVLGRDALIKNKRASARPKDLADVVALEALASKR